jgi:hypothetical protein
VDEQRESTYRERFGKAEQELKCKQFGCYSFSLLAPCHEAGAEDAVSRERALPSAKVSKETDDDMEVLYHGLWPTSFGNFL